MRRAKVLNALFRVLYFFGLGSSLGRARISVRARPRISTRPSRGTGLKGPTGLRQFWPERGKLQEKQHAISSILTSSADVGGHADSAMTPTAERSQVRKLVGASLGHRADVIHFVSMVQFFLAKLTAPVSQGTHFLFLQRRQTLASKRRRCFFRARDRRRRSLWLPRVGMRHKPVPKSKRCRSQKRTLTHDPHAQHHEQECARKLYGKRSNAHVDFFL